MLISACLITRNEEWTIQRCLESLKDVVDEIIVVDTGSTDNTVSLARQAGARVFLSTWKDDFSIARNESLSHASGDYVLVIDADEYLDADQRTNLRAVLEREQPEALIVQIRNYAGSLANISGASMLWVTRVFRRGHLYEGAIHEQVANSVISSGGRTMRIDLTFHHLGYLEEFVRLRGKSARNVSLLNKELENDPDSWFHRCNLMAEHMQTQEFGACADLGMDLLSEIRQSPVETWPPYTARIFNFLTVALWHSGDKQTAMDVAREGIGHYPWLTDLKTHYGEMLLGDGRKIEAVNALMEARAQGDPTGSHVDTLEGMGTYYASLRLGEAWLALGDVWLAREWHLRAFVEHPSLAGALHALVYLLPKDPVFLYQHLESRIGDAATYALYAEVYTVNDVPDAAAVIERAESAFGSSSLLVRARMAASCRNSPQTAAAYAEQHPSEETWMLAGMYHAEENDMTFALECFSKAGPRGEYLSQVLASLRQPNLELRLGDIARDIVLAHAARLLRKLLPHATDLETAWAFFAASPLAHVLTEIEWPGATSAQCEKNALRAFQSGAVPAAEYWTARAMDFEPTVTRVLLECDIALAKGGRSYMAEILRQGCLLFPASEMLKRVQEQTGETILAEEDPFMNPADIYRKNAVLTMPLHVQLVKLHEQGSLLTQEILQCRDADDIPAMRARISQLQDIITYLRASLDRSISLADVTDQTYAFYYSTLVRWYLQPSAVEETYDAMLGFWTSWAETWMKVQPQSAGAEAR